MAVYHRFLKAPSGELRWTTVQANRLAAHGQRLEQAVSECEWLDAVGGEFRSRSKRNSDAEREAGVHEKKAPRAFAARAQPVLAKRERWVLQRAGQPDSARLCKCLFECPELIEPHRARVPSTALERFAFVPREPSLRDLYSSYGTIDALRIDARRTPRHDTRNKPARMRDVE